MNLDLNCSSGEGERLGRGGWWLCRVQELRAWAQHLYGKALACTARPAGNCDGGFFFCVNKQSGDREKNDRVGNFPGAKITDGCRVASGLYLRGGAGRGGIGESRTGCWGSPGPGGQISENPDRNSGKQTNKPTNNLNQAWKEPLTSESRNKISIIAFKDESNFE